MLTGDPGPDRVTKSGAVNRIPFLTTPGKPIDTRSATRKRRDERRKHVDELLWWTWIRSLDPNAVAHEPAGCVQDGCFETGAADIDRQRCRPRRLWCDHQVRVPLTSRPASGRPLQVRHRVGFRLTSQFRSARVRRRSGRQPSAARISCPGCGRRLRPPWAGGLKPTALQADCSGRSLGDHVAMHTSHAAVATLSKPGSDKHGADIVFHPTSSRPDRSVE